MNYTRLNQKLADTPATKITSLEYKMLDRAIGLAEVSACSPHKLGAVIFKRRNIIGRGYNSKRSHPLQARYNKLSINLHAEIAALIEGLRESPEDLDGAAIAVARVRRSGDLGCSYPCSSCLAALTHVGINRIVCVNEKDVTTAISI